MALSTRLLLKAGAVGLMLVAAIVPLSNVAAHECKSAVPEAPSDPADADTGCNGAACPANSGTTPHHHSNGVPPEGPWLKECRSGGADTMRGGQKNQPGHDAPGRGPGPRVPGIDPFRLAEAPLVLFLVECSDGVDNDADGGTDWLGSQSGGFEDWDGGCTWPGDPSETVGPDVCFHFPPHSHTYFMGGSLIAAGAASVTDTNSMDCDGDILPDFDGDYETGIGGGFFGYGPWAFGEPCDYDVWQHGATVTVNDLVWGSGVAFTIGADDTSGPVIAEDPVSGETTCSTSGSITPGTPGVDPVADADDCLSYVYVGSGTTCGAGGDGGYWVFLEFGVVANTPTAGTLTA